MACCGKQRSQSAGPDGRGGSPPERCFFRYVGRTALTVAGPVSGQYYRFPAPGATVEVDPRDAPAVEQVPQLRRV